MGPQAQAGAGTNSSGITVYPNSLLGWRDMPALKLLNMYYDVTPSKFITMVISEVGLIPSTSAPTVLRDPNLMGTMQ
jgi:translation initiation factor 2B subunit (eIF-2B alpha/beta/delta family)